MLHYTFDDTMINIEENIQEEDISFQIQVKSEEMRKRLKQVRSYFDENKDFTDVMFYSHEDGTYEAIVRIDAKEAFLLQAFRFHCLKSLSWE